MSVKALGVSAPLTSGRSTDTVGWVSEEEDASPLVWEWRPLPLGCRSGGGFEVRLSEGGRKGEDWVVSGGVVGMGTFERVK